MTFIFPPPHATFQVVVKAAFGFSPSSDPLTWVFTDISKYVRGAIAFSGGAQRQGSTADPATVYLSLNNTDGRFTAKNPFSAFWPNVVQNVPLWVGVTWRGAADVYEVLTTFVNGWPLQPNAGLIDVTVPITATGRLRRLEKSAKTVISPMTRAIAMTAPLAWWPLEDGAQATQGASGLPNGTPIKVIGKVNFASGGGAPGSGPLADLSAGGRLFAKLPKITASSYRWELVVEFGSLSPGTHETIMQWTTPGGGVDWWEIAATDVADGGLYIHWSSTEGTVFDTYISNVPVDDGAAHHIRIDMSKVSGHHKVVVYLDGDQVINITTTRNWSTPASLLVNPSGTIANTVPTLGELVFWGPWDAGSTVDTVAAFGGYAGELASDRVTRLCAENGIPVIVNVGTLPSQAMGVQGVDKIYSLLQACADVDNGLLHDAGPLGSLVFTSGTARYNAPVAIALDYQRHQIGDGLAGTYDDQDLVNESQISRTNGSSVIYDDPESQAITDVYSVPATVDAAADGQLLDIAGFRTHLGTFDGYQFSSISADVRRNPELAQAVTGLMLPARISPTRVPIPYPPESMDQFAEGFTGSLDSTIWQMSFNCSPYGPWRVGVYDESKYDSRTSSLADDMDEGDVGDEIEFVVSTTDILDRWTTEVDELDPAVRGPLLIYTDGEVMTVTDIASEVGDGFAGRTVSGGFGTAPTGQAWTAQASAANFAVGSGHATITPSASASDRIIWVDADDSTVHVVVLIGALSGLPAADVSRIGAVAEYTDLNNHYLGYVEIGTAGAVTAVIAKRVAGTLTTLGKQLLPTSGIYNPLDDLFISFTSVNTGSGCTLELRVYPQDTGMEPFLPTVGVFDTSLTASKVGVFLRRQGTLPSAFTIKQFAVDTTTQTFSATRGDNGVTIAHPAGSPVHLSDPAVIAL